MVKFHPKFKKKSMCAFNQSLKIRKNGNRMAQAVKDSAVLEVLACKLKRTYPEYWSIYCY